MGALLTRPASLLTNPPPPSTRSPRVSSTPPPTTDKLIHLAEANIFKYLTATPHTRRPISLPSGNVINTLTFGSAYKPALLLLHGWGSASAFYAPTIDLLVSHYRVYLIDWLGFGASSRPDHSLTLAPKEAEDYFIDALHEWVEVMRKLDGIDSYYVVAHSMGAFLGACYALKHPEAVRALVLTSPVGIPLPPESKTVAGSLVRKMLFQFIFTLWERGYTPQYLIRLLPAFLGQKLATRIITPRFPVSNPHTQQAFCQYFYHISCAPGSGEHSLSTILESGAYARRPLYERMRAMTVKTMFLYGDRDWMDHRVAREVVENMSVSATVELVRGAGHHVYFDNAPEFVRNVKQLCRDGHFHN